MKDASMKGKICLVTGATSGIGKAAALQLADRGATVFMVARDIIRGNLALQEVKDRTGSSTVRLLKADLASLREVTRLAESFRKQHDRLHVLVNNAAITPSHREETEDGLEMQFAVNYLSHFYLTHLLLEPLQKSGEGRIVNVSSKLHEWGTLDLEDLQWQKRPYGQIRVYADTKLANLLFTYELNRRLEGRGVTVNALHPGLVFTNIYRTVPAPLRSLFTLFMSSPGKGSDTLVYLATAPHLQGVSGRYFVKRKEIPSSPSSYDPELAARLWESSEVLVKRTLDSPGHFVSL